MQTQYISEKQALTVLTQSRRLCSRNNVNEQGKVK